jgi:hypothetical protein
LAGLSVARNPMQGQHMPVQRNLNQLHKLSRIVAIVFCASATARVAVPFGESWIEFRPGYRIDVYALGTGLIGIVSLAIVALRILKNGLSSVVHDELLWLCIGVFMILTWPQFYALQQSGKNRREENEEKMYH